MNIKYKKTQLINLISNREVKGEENYTVAVFLVATETVINFGGVGSLSRCYTQMKIS